MKKYLILAGLSGLLAVGPLPVAARSFHGRLDASVWYGRGEVTFQSPDLDPLISSDLVYPFRGYLGEVRGEALISFRLGDIPSQAGLRGRLARHIDLQGTATDSDWSFGWRWGYSEHDSRTRLLIWDVDAVFSLFPFAASGGPPVLNSLESGLIAGYGQERYQTTARDGWGIYDGWFEEFSGRVMTYKPDFSGPRIGAYLQSSPLSGLTVRLEAILIPALQAESRARWILREYRFRQEAEGTGFNLSARIDYELTDYLGVFAGIRRVDLNADRRGLESGEEGDESYRNQPIVGWIRSQYTGYELGARLLF